MLRRAAGTGRRSCPCDRPWSGRTSPTHSPRGSLPGPRSRRVVLEVLRQTLAAVDPLLELRVRDVSRDDHRPAQRQPRADRILRRARRGSPSSAGQIDRHDVAAEVGVRDVRQVLRRLGLELLEEHAVARDLAERLAIRRAATPRSRPGSSRRGAAGGSRARRGRSICRRTARRSPSCARSRRPSPPTRDRGMRARWCRQLSADVEVARRRQLRGLERVLGARAADHDGEVIRRARRGAERAQLLIEERAQRSRVEQRLGLLEQQALVRRAAALGHEQEVVFVAGRSRRTRSAPASSCRCSSPRTCRAAQTCE